MGRLAAADDRAKLEAYRGMAAEETSARGVWFGGRLGTYQYLDMHQAIAAALGLAEKLEVGLRR